MSAQKSCLKRANNTDDGNAGPFKKMKVDKTGLENTPVLENITQRTQSTITNVQESLYRRRAEKHAAIMQKKKKARVGFYPIR